MARGGGRSDFERMLAQRREDERLARERKRQEQEREKAREQEELDSRRRDAERKTVAVQEQLTRLDEVLTGVLSLPPLTFERLTPAPKEPEFAPGPLGVAAPAPDRAAFSSAGPSGLRRLLDRLPRPGKARIDRERATARSRFEAAQEDHRRQEAERRRQLAIAKARYDQKVTDERAKAAARNAYVTQHRSAFAAGDPEAVEWFAGCVLRASRYPDGFPRDHQVAYRPQVRELAVDFELPPPGVVPGVRGYRYIEDRDVVEPVPRPEAEVRQRYQRLIASVALRTLHEIFTATPPDVVAAVTFTGRVSTTDPATGQPARPRLLSVSVARPVFGALVLAAVDPAACLTHLGALISPDPCALDPATPEVPHPSPATPRTPVTPPTPTPATPRAPATPPSRPSEEDKGRDNQ